VGRRIVLIPADQQRFDAYGVNGSQVARTPAADRLASQSFNGAPACAANGVCMPTRSTFLDIAGAEQPSWMQGCPLPTAAVEGNERLLTTWDSQSPETGIVMQTIIRDALRCTTYDKGPLYDGAEAEPYDLEADPHQWHNLWDDPVRASLRTNLMDDLIKNLAERRSSWPKIEAVA
jgi:arylsulfatase A-like enzyme